MANSREVSNLQLPRPIAQPHGASFAERGRVVQAEMSQFDQIVRQLQDDSLKERTIEIANLPEETGIPRGAYLN